MAYIYKITNTKNNKAYIGYTSKTVESRWAEHQYDALTYRDNRKFYHAIRKHGVDCWQVETLLEINTTEEAKIKEIELILLHETYDHGYNATRGGDGNNGIVMSAESNKKRSDALKGKAKSEETIEKFRQRTQTQESKDKISEAHKNMKKPWVKWSKEQIKTRAMTRRGLSKEQYDKMNELRQQGLTIVKIAEQIGSNGDMVKKWLKREWEL